MPLKATSLWALLLLSMAAGPLTADPKALTATAKAKAAKPLASSKPASAEEIGKLDAVRLGVGSVSTAPAWDKAAFPIASQFQDPRITVKVPSPDGKRLVWRGLDKKGYCLFISDADGRHEKRLDKCKNGYQPHWSPDGKQLLFSAMDWRIEARNLFLYDIAKDSSLRAFNAKKEVGALASFSPDGKKILFTYFGDLWMMNANGIGRSLLNVYGKINRPIGEASLIAWSKDGSAFCYQMRGEATVTVVHLAPRI
jgi:hypothetical protein